MFFEIESSILSIVALKGFNKYFYVVVHGAYVLSLVAVIAGVAANVFAGDLGAVPVIWKSLLYGH